MKKAGHPRMTGGLSGLSASRIGVLRLGRQLILGPGRNGVNIGVLVSHEVQIADRN
jgi:hypothetical protein